VNCNLGTLANGGTATVAIVVTPMRAGTIANIADVSADEVDGNQLNNEDKEFTEVVAAANGCTILGTAASETILGTAGDDVICAGGGDDTLKGYLGADTLRGEAGVDRLYGGAGNDVFDGGTGLDRVIFADFPAASAVFADLSGASPVCGGTPCSQNAELGHDTFITSGGLSTVEMLTGTKYGDTFIGDAGPNTLTGVDGPDTLTGGGGIDSLLGMAGNDTLGGQGEHDVLQGGPGNDSLDGGADSDTASYYSDPGGATAVGTTITDGYGGTDTLISVENIQGSNAGNDSLTGTSVRDQMYGNGGNDSLIGLAGNDYLHGGVGTDTIDGGIGTDTCLAGETVTNCERSILQGPNQGNPDLPLLLAAQAAERQALVDSRSG
jgi:Ca2+-binding RTX toxin-like protein